MVDETDKHRFDLHLTAVNCHSKNSCDVQPLPKTNMALKILLVGTGITSAVTAALLRKKCQEQIQLVVWDKARGTGGRMSTSRSPTENKCIADLGAQYITSLPDNMLKHTAIYGTLLKNGLLEPLRANVEGLRQFPSGTQHFVAPLGMSSLAKHFLAEAAGETHFGHHVSSISRQDARWEVVTQAGVKEVFDVVILTMPVPQILQLTGTVQDVIAATPAVNKGMTETKYSSRYALGMFYEKRNEPSMPWDVKYLADNAVLRYVAFDNRKRNRPDEPTALVFHTSVGYGVENIERSAEDVQRELTSEIRKLYPDLPEPDSVKCQKWRYSQVLTAFPGMPGVVTLAHNPLLVAGGDGFCESNFDGCVSSAMKLSDEVATAINNKNKSRPTC